MNGLLPDSLGKAPSGMYSGKCRCARRQEACFLFLTDYTDFTDGEVIDRKKSSAYSVLSVRHFCFFLTENTESTEMFRLVCGWLWGTV